MNNRVKSLVALLPIAVCLAACEKAESPQHRVTYEDDVAPILQEHCVVCHVAGQPGATESGLLMDNYESLIKGSRFGRIIEPGDAMTSSLYLLVSGKSRLIVSMPHGEEPLSAEEIETIRVWIDKGAVEN
jgi:hypothetical protein